MKRIIIFILFLNVLSSVGCEKYLEYKPDKKLVVPTTIQDAQAMLDNSNVFNIVGPLSIQLAADDHYLVTEDWFVASLTDRNSYIWKEDVFNDADNNDWSSQYIIVYYANVILEAIENGSIKGSEVEINNIKGQSLFSRSFAFYNLLQVFAKPYFIQTPSNEPGIPLRLLSDPNLQFERADLMSSYAQVIQDLQLAVNLLPEKVTFKTRASKSAAQALLARIYLSIEDYENALYQANDILSRHSELLDYNDLDATKANPFEVFNKEVIYHSSTSLRRIAMPPSFKIDTNLYKQYEDVDLRKKLYFQGNGDGSISFKGSYVGGHNLFNGLSFDEIHLIYAECLIREGKLEEGMKDLNSLLQNRYKRNKFVPLEFSGKNEALDKVLLERRKQLLFRSVRWSDLRRLNNDPTRTIELKRFIDGKEYLLSPNSERYVFKIPINVIEMSGIRQN